MKKRQKKRRRLFLQVFLVLSMLLASSQICLADTGGKEKASQQVVPDNVESAGYDVIFCIDNSGSVWSQQEVRDQAVRSICNLAMGSDIRIGGIYFGNAVYKKLGLTSVENKDGSLEVLKKFLNERSKDNNNRDTNIGMALENARALFEDQDASRKRIIILFSDGINENLAQDSSYKQAADAKTEEQVKLLESEGVPIYCVYLQKERNDEEYLRNLVNYFNTENSFDEERFKKVTEGQIEILSEQFAQVFYAMQNNMKYREIAVDTEGKMNFYVPELGVRRIQIFMDGNTQYEAVLDSPDETEEEVSSWTDGKSAYITVNNPSPGDWAVEISGENKDKVKGSLAYYAYLSAKAELVTVEGEKVDKTFKNKEQILQVSFYDEEGEKVELNSGAQVQAMIEIDGSKEESKQLGLTANEGIWRSEAFALKSYGTYTIRLSVQYEDLVDLQYTVLQGNVEGQAPVAKNIEGNFSGTRQGEKFTFSLKKSDLYTDPEGEEVSIEKITQINKENPVEIQQEDEILVVSAAKAGDIEFALNLKDETGLQSIATIKGKIKDRESMDIQTIGIIIVIGAVAFGIIRVRGRKKLYREIQVKRDKVEAQYSVLDEKYRAFMEILAKTDNIAKAYGKMTGDFREYHEQYLTQEQLEIYGILPYLTKDLGNKSRQEAEEVKETANKKKGTADEQKRLLIQARKDDKKAQLKKIWKETQSCEKSIADVGAFIEEKSVKMKELFETIEKEGGEFNEKRIGVLEMLETPIKCALAIQWGAFIGGRSIVREGKIAKGFYQLDDVKLLTEGSELTLGKALQGESTGIYVYGYEKNGTSGLRLESKRGFEIKEAASGQEFQPVQNSVLLQGRKYKVKTECTGIIILEVE